MATQRASQRRMAASEEKLARGIARATKQRGEIAEAAFLSKASSMGFAVAKPWGDSHRYDFIVDVDGRLLKVQVKSAHRPCAQVRGGYQIGSHSRQLSAYRADEIDLLVAYIVPENIWYVFPPSVFENKKSMRLCPQGGKRSARAEQYREAWHAFYELTPAKTERNE